MNEHKQSMVTEVKVRVRAKVYDNGDGTWLAVVDVPPTSGAAMGRNCEDALNKVAELISSMTDP